MVIDAIARIVVQHALDHPRLQQLNLADDRQADDLQIERFKVILPLFRHQTLGTQFLAHAVLLSCTPINRGNIFDNADLMTGNIIRSVSRYSSGATFAWRFNSAAMLKSRNQAFHRGDGVGGSRQLSMMLTPPSTKIVLPVIRRAYGVARNAQV